MSATSNSPQQMPSSTNQRRLPRRRDEKERSFNRTEEDILEWLRNNPTIYNLGLINYRGREVNGTWLLNKPRRWTAPKTCWTRGSFTQILHQADQVQVWLSNWSHDRQTVMGHWQRVLSHYCSLRPWPTDIKYPHRYPWMREWLQKQMQKTNFCIPKIQATTCSSSILMICHQFPWQHNITFMPMTRPLLLMARQLKKSMIYQVLNFILCNVGSVPISLYWICPRQTLCYSQVLIIQSEINN